MGDCECKAEAFVGVRTLRERCFDVADWKEGVDAPEPPCGVRRDIILLEGRSVGLLTRVVPGNG